MITPLIYKRRPTLGFDLGTTSAKIVQIKLNSTRVSGYTQANYPQDAIVEGIVVDPEPIAAALRPAMRRALNGRLTATTAVVSLPTGLTFIRLLNLPHMSDVELGAAVQLEAEQYVPVPIAHLYLDYEVIDHDEKSQTILMVAAPSAVVDSYVLLFNSLGIETVLVEPSIISVIRSIAPADLKNRVSLIVDIESESTNLAIHDKSIRLTNTIASGGNDITKLLASKLGLKFEKAEDLKIKFGMDGSDLGARIETILEPLIKTLVKELTKIISYYNEQVENGRPVDSIVLAGGTAHLPGLIEHLTKITKLPVLVVDPWSSVQTTFGVKAPNERQASAYTTAIGLARLGAKL